MARIITACIVFVVAGAATMLLFSMRPNLLQTAEAKNGIDPKVFSDGLGIYVLNDGKYSMLVWRKRLVGSAGAPEEKDIMEASQQAMSVKKDVRFFAYGIDISKWPVVPPYLMAFCVVRDPRTVEGVFPIRIKKLDQNDGPIYELVLPEIVENLASGAFKTLFWTINFQYSCNDGWPFRFQ